jgi:tetratricopeptide (TPR) repeat protein
MRQAFTYGSAYLTLGRPDEALAESGQAIELSAQAPAGERQHHAEACARADMATAHLLRGDLDGARDAVSEVLALDPGMRIESVVRRVGALRQVLAGPSFQHRQGQALAEEIEQFTAVPAGHALPVAPS